MIPETGLKCVISGSFEKFKPEIDRTIEEFQDLGVTVLAPEKGWLLKPKYKVLQFRPLPNEVGMSIRQIEDNFLSALRESNFQYVENPDGYVGNSAALEIGFALSLDIPVFSRQKISALLDPEPIWEQAISQILALTPSAVVKNLTSPNL